MSLWDEQSSGNRSLNVLCLLEQRRWDVGCCYLESVQFFIKWRHSTTMQAHDYCRNMRPSYQRFHAGCWQVSVF